MSGFIIPGMLLGIRRRTGICIVRDRPLCPPIFASTLNINATIRIGPVDEGWVWVFPAVDHFDACCIGIVPVRAALAAADVKLQAFLDFDRTVNPMTKRSRLCLNRLHARHGSVRSPWVLLGPVGTAPAAAVQPPCHEQHQGETAGHDQHDDIRAQARQARQVEYQFALVLRGPSLIAARFAV